MTQLIRSGFSADEFRQRADLFCFTDIRLDITPQQSLKLQEQLLRISELLTGIIDTYYTDESSKRFDYIAFISSRLAKRFYSIGRSLQSEGISLEPLMLFKHELATELYNDCVKLNDTDLYDALNSFLYRRERRSKGEMQDNAEER